ncbi:hypothetical protein CTI12_AA357310 [Artemisia annua]|uniref:KIB1-4 beta-propeller domain-containing protein n=1 Tax=Artemisia annua TaxID=35608 RepID=A0A2U1MPE2_ARTAN|nr:hypothetical protein CTI12_AA357310 [Artemisia annua]
MLSILTSSHRSCKETQVPEWTSLAVQWFTSLMLAQKSNDKEFRELLLLSNKNIRKKSIRKIRLPQIYDKVFKTSCGWLATVGEDYASQLIHPLSCEIINLPKVDTFDPDQFKEHSQWYQGINKLLLIPNNIQSSLALPLVVVLWGCSRKLGFCRPGDNKWTAVGMGQYDFTYYNGRVYCFNWQNQVRAWDVHGEDPTVLVDVSTMPLYLYHYGDVTVAYLIGLDDGERKRLLVVIREHHEYKGKYRMDKNHKTKRFVVFAYDLENKEWSKVKDLGTKALFVGDASFWLEEDTAGVIKGNCIYFTDDAYFLHGHPNGKGRDMGIYHLSDETIKPYFNGVSLSNVTPPIWLRSS